MAERRFLTNIDREALEQAIAEKVDAAAVNTAVANLVDSAPDTLNTLNELAAALGDDPNFATTITNQIAGKADKSEIATNIVNGSKPGSVRTIKANETIGRFAFAEGNSTTASGQESHAEGSNTTASGLGSHAEGSFTTASGECSHTEGENTAASNSGSHAEGKLTIASGQYSHTEGYETNAAGNNSHAEGYQTLTYGNSSHAEGHSSKTIGNYSHAEGISTSIGNYSHAEGASRSVISLKLTGEANSLTYTYTSRYSHLLLYKKSAIYYNEKYILIDNLTENTITLKSTLDSTNPISGVEVDLIASGSIGDYSHSEGEQTLSTGYGSHTEGIHTLTAGIGSHAEGYGTTANSDYQHVAGKNNIADENGDYAYIIGNGSSLGINSNAHTLAWDGTAWFAGDVYVGSTNGTNKDDGSKKLATEEFVNAAIPSINGLATETYVNNAVGNKVDKSITINGQPLYSDVILTASDVNAASESYVDHKIGNLMDNMVGPAISNAVSDKLSSSGWSPNSVLTTDGQGNVVATKIGEEGSPFEEQLLYSGSFPNLVASAHNEVTLNFNLTAGANYSVYVNGTKYSVICEYLPMNAMLVLGNKHIIQDTQTDTGEPFFIYEKTGPTEAGLQYIMVGASGNYEISIYTLVPTSGSTSGSGGASLAGKKILILGDSVNAGNGWEGGFANLINEDFAGVTVNNSSISGAQLAGKGIYGQLQVTFQSGFIPDYIIFDGGGNDILLNVPEGSVDIDTYSTEGYGNEFDTSTIAGAFENLVTNMQKFMPNAKIIFFNLYKMHPTATSITYTKQRQVWNLLRECCEKYSIRYVDLWGEGNFTPNSTEQWNAFMYDWIHINEAGYRRFWPLIRKILLEEASSIATIPVAEEASF